MVEILIFRKSLQVSGKGKKKVDFLGVRSSVPAALRYDAGKYFEGSRFTPAIVFHSLTPVLESNC